MPEKISCRQLTSNLLFWISFIDKGFSFDEVAKLQLRNDLLVSLDLAIDVATREALDEMARINKDRLDQREKTQAAAQEQARDVTHNLNKGDGSRRNFRKLTDAEMEQRERHRADVELLRRANERVDEHPGECQEGATGGIVFSGDNRGGDTVMARHRFGVGWEYLRDGKWVSEPLGVEAAYRHAQHSANNQERPDGGPPAQQQNERGR